MDILLLVTNMFVGFQSIIPGSSSSLLLALSLSVEEEVYKLRLTIIDI